MHRNLKIVFTFKVLIEGTNTFWIIAMTQQFMVSNNLEIRRIIVSQFQRYNYILDFCFRYFWIICLIIGMCFISWLTKFKAISRWNSDNIYIQRQWIHAITKVSANNCFWLHGQLWRTISIVCWCICAFNCWIDLLFQYQMHFFFHQIFDHK